MRISDWSSDVCSSDLLQYYGQDNIAVDRPGNPLPQFGRYGETRAELTRAKAPLAPVAGYAIVPTRDVEASVLATAGARPWARDGEEIDPRRGGEGKVVSEGEDHGGRRRQNKNKT